MVQTLSYLDVLLLTYYRLINNVWPACETPRYQLKIKRDIALHK